jgi:hypothetical protein
MTAAYEAPSSGGPSCRLLVGACSPVTDLAGRGADRALGAGRLAAGSDESPDPDGSEGLRLPAVWRDLAATPCVVLRIPAYTVVFFLRVVRANLSSLRRATSLSCLWLADIGRRDQRYYLSRTIRSTLFLDRGAEAAGTEGERESAVL